MRDFIKNYGEWILYVYTILSLSIALVRLFDMDCASRYADYVFPLSKLHCEVK